MACEKINKEMKLSNDNLPLDFDYRIVKKGCKSQKEGRDRELILMVVEMQYIYIPNNN